MNSVRISLVTGSDETNEKLSAIMSSEGYSVIGTHVSGGDALRMVRAHVPELIMINYTLPDMTGRELASIICADNICPVIMLVSSSERVYCEDLVDEMNVVLVEKPMSRIQILSAIDITLQQAKLIRNLESKISKLSDSLESRKFIERAKSMLIVANPESTEEEIYNAMRTASMNQRMPIKRIAELVIEGKMDLGVLTAMA
ncbi:MAG: response regulator [Bacillota bacterium]